MSIELIKSVRERTGLPLKDIKKAVEEIGNDEETVIKHLREQGVLKQGAREGRETNEGAIFSYIHDNNKLGVMLQLASETDFVAKSEDFLNLGNDLVLHIAAMSPKFISEEEVSEDYVTSELEIAKNQLVNEGKPEDKIEMILNGKKKKLVSEVCLLTQPFLKDSSVTVSELIAQISQKTGEKISVVKFVVYSI